VDLAFFGRLFDPERFDEHFVLEGPLKERAEQADGQGAVLVTGHFGNWELTQPVFRRIGLATSAVARHQGAGWFARRLERFRRAHGQETIPKGNALPAAMKAIRAGRVVVFLADQSAGADGIPVPFFGKPVQTFVAPAALALKLGVPLFAGCTERLGPGIRYRCRSELVPAEADPARLMHKVNAILERYVRDRPEQWWWFHRRFKPTHFNILGVPWSSAGVPLTEFVPATAKRPLLDALREIGPHFNALVVEADEQLEDPARRPSRLRYLRTRFEDARASTRALREAADRAEDDHARAVADRMDGHLDGVAAALDACAAADDGTAVATALAAYREAAAGLPHRLVRLGHSLLLDEARAAGATARDVVGTTLKSLRRHYDRTGCPDGARLCRRLQGAEPQSEAFAAAKRELDARFS
jgi:hypothetical protein